MLYESSRSAQFASSLMQPIMGLVGNLQFVTTAVVGGLGIANGTISLGAVQAMLQYVRQFGQPLQQLASTSATFQSGLASLERVGGVARAGRDHARPGEPRTNRPGTRSRRVRGRVVLVRPDRPADRRAHADRRTGRDRRHRRPDRCRQDHPRQSAAALLRTRRRADHARRTRHRVDAETRATQRVRHGVAGHLALRGHDPRQHPLRQPERRPTRT